MRVKIFSVPAIFLVLMTMDVPLIIAQNIGINNTGAAPASSALLDVNATDKGLLIPRLNTNQRNSISFPATGLFIYNSTVNKIEYWNGTNWIQLSGSTVIAINTTGTNSGGSVSISATGSPADPSAMLDIQSSTGGFLIPRMTTTQRNAIISPVAGLLLYNITTGLLDFYSTSGWQELCGISVSTSTGATITPANVGINTASPDPSAMLELTSVTTGIAIPRLTSMQRDAIQSPAQGLMLYNTTTQSINIYTGAGAWADYNPQTAPGSPIGSIHIPSQNQIVWNWNMVPGATGFKYNSINDYASANDIGTVTTYTQTGLNCNTPDTLYVWAYNCSGNSTATVLTQSTAACTYVCGQTGTFVDGRDGQTYGYVDIPGSATPYCLGNSQRWMCQNLNVGTLVNSVNTGSTHSEVSNNGVIEKYCIGNSSAFCDTFGGLYEWNELMNYGASVSGNGPGPQGICPTGWHIPTEHEWKCLEMNVGMTQTDVDQLQWWGDASPIKEAGTVHWTGPNTATNSSGFTGLPGGLRRQYGATTESIDQSAGFWTATNATENTSHYYYYALFYQYPGIGHGHDIPQIGFSVRCIKN